MSIFLIAAIVGLVIGVMAGIEDCRQKSRDQKLRDMQIRELKQRGF